MFRSVTLTSKFLPKFQSAILLRFNHYKSLGLSPDATQSEIKSAYYKLSKIYHPDKNNGSEESTKKFRDITTAYEVLGKEDSRRMYDLQEFYKPKPDVDFGFRSQFDQRIYKRYQAPKQYKKVWKCKTASRPKKKNKKFKRKFGNMRNFGPFSFDDTTFSSYAFLFLLVIQHV